MGGCEVCVGGYVVCHILVYVVSECAGSVLVVCVCECVWFSCHGLCNLWSSHVKLATSTAFYSSLLAWNALLCLFTPILLRSYLLQEVFPDFLGCNECSARLPQAPSTALFLH